MKTNIFLFGLGCLLILSACELQKFESIEGGLWSRSTLSSVEAIVKGYTDSNVVGKIESVGLDIDGQNLLLNLAVPNLFSLNGWQKELNGLPGAFLKSYIAKDGTSAVQLTMPLNYLFQRSSTQVKRELPTGDSIPFIGGALMNSIEVPAPQDSNKFIVYYGYGVVGLFAQVPYDTFYKLSVPVRGQDIDDVVGYVTTIPKTTSDGGVILAVKIPEAAMKVLKQK